jgi:hypothetical protein
MQPHYPGMGRGLARSLFALVWGASHYIRVCRTPESGLSQVVGNSVAGPPIGYLSGRHLGSPAVAPELRLSNWGRLLGHAEEVLHRVGTHTKVDEWKALIGCLSWHSMLCGDDAHTMSIQMVWVKCTTSAECKSIRIAESSIMDGWTGCCLTQCQVLVYKMFSEKWRKVPDGVLEGYCRGTVMVRSTCRVLSKGWKWSCVIDLDL